ncbi:hypothetical protein [Brevundimonas sp.]|uniref:hypothetical protein n=1 Tax=Brevundimonas sp. TaxID=1871086 RepID=UPI003F72E313
MVPPWAAADPAPTTAPAPDGATPAANPVTPPVAPAAEVAPKARFIGVRKALGRYARTGDGRAARSALGHWARTGVGGSRAGAARVSRAARTGGAALAGLARAASDLGPAPGALDIRGLAGLPVEAAIAQIVDAFCPPGILDEDLARLAVGEALAEVLGGADTFDPAAIDPNAAMIGALAFAAELVFLQVAGDAGQAFGDTPPALAVQREADIRALVKEVSDSVGAPLLQAAGPLVTPSAMAGLVSRLVGAVVAEMETW